MTKDDATWLNYCYGFFALAIIYLIFQAIATAGLYLGWSERYDEWFPAASNLVAIFGGLSAAWWLRSAVDRREYHLAAIGEVRKVSWPSVPDTKRMTLIVCVVVAVFAVILAAFDILWSNALQFVLP